MATELPRAALRLGSLIGSVYIVALLSKPCGNKRLKQTHPSAALAQRVRVAVTSCNPGLRSHRALPHQQRKSNDARLRPFRCNRNWRRYPRLHRDNCRPRTRLLVPVATCCFTQRSESYTCRPLQKRLSLNPGNVFPQPAASEVFDNASDVSRMPNKGSSTPGM